ncbi:MAG: hypothetical protein FGM54_12020, partial [Chitinophagaceae bacterium]|nr:hypothetical protein [Chitinophagaceae bacterium]
MKTLVFSLLALLSVASVHAQAIPDWSTSVAGILYQNCTPCHHGGGSGHGNFVDYDSAKAYAGSIGFYAAVGYMPPWPPDTSRRFVHERRLTQAEINTLQSWMLNGTPKGDTSLAPPKPVYNANSQLNIPPDAVFAMPNFTIPSGGSNDVYWNIVPRLTAKVRCVTSHYPYIDATEKWSQDNYETIFRGMIELTKLPNVFVYPASQKDRQVYLQKGQAN